MFIISTILVYIGIDRKQTNWLPLLWGVLLPVIMAGMRSESIGTDTSNYHMLFEEFCTNPTLSYCPEPFYYLISQLARIVNWFPLIPISYQLFSVIFVLAAFRNKNIKCIKYKIPSSIIILMYYLMFYNASLNIMRQITAISYLLFISQYLGNHRKFLILLLIGFGWHSTVIFGGFLVLIAYLISRLKGMVRIIAIGLYISALSACQFIILKIFNVLSVNNLGVLAMKATSYSLSSAGGASWSYVLTSIISLILLLLGWNYYKLRYNDKIFIFLLIVSELAFYLLGNYSPPLMRLALYFSVYYCVFVPMLISSANIAYNQRSLLYIGTLAYFLFYWWFIYVRSESGHTIPYEFSTI